MNCAMRDQRYATRVNMSLLEEILCCYRGSLQPPPVLGKQVTTGSPFSSLGIFAFVHNSWNAPDNMVYCQAEALKFASMTNASELKLNVRSPYRIDEL